MKRLGWGKSGTLTTGKEAQFTSLSASFEEPTTFTVQFDVQQGATAGFAIATVIWTVNGVSFTRTIDVAAGSSISGLAESVRVIVNDATDVTVYPSGVEYVVSVTIAGRPRPTTATPPVFTGLQATSLNTGQTIPVQVPNGANSVAVYGTTNTPGTPVAIQVDMVALTTPGGFE
jgi:hypothetical protein